MIVVCIRDAFCMWYCSEYMLVFGEHISIVIISYEKSNESFSVQTVCATVIDSGLLLFLVWHFAERSFCYSIKRPMTAPLDCSVYRLLSTIKTCYCIFRLQLLALLGLFFIHFNRLIIGSKNEYATVICNLLT